MYCYSQIMLYVNTLEKFVPHNVSFYRNYIDFDLNFNKIQLFEWCYV
jgi:hypothetical protein